MFTLELDAREAQELREVLQSVLSELRMEIAATDLKDFRDKLKQREAFLKTLLARLEEAA